jgi:regulator of nucleoside diphosphate kinase
MAEKQIQLTDSDHRRLKTLLRYNWIDRGEDASDLRRLENELDRAHVVKPTEVPKDVVTMNSSVTLRDLDSGDAVDFSLVFPTAPHAAGADDAMKVSVLAPLGMAVLGYRVGDTFEWEVPAGVRRLRVEDVSFQPESAGRYDL